MKFTLKVIISLIGMNSGLTSLHAQSINIGQSCPDVLLTNVINYPEQQIRLSDFRGKLVILDFWSPGCLSCIEAFDEMDSLQKRFAGRIQILAVNSQSPDSTKRFFKKHKKIKIPGIPFITGDTTLKAFFPHGLFPHHVWIDAKGTVKYITDGWNTNAKNIESFLEGNDLSLGEKKDLMIKVDWSKPLLAIRADSIVDKVTYYSYIMHAIAGISSFIGFQKQNGSLRPNRITMNMVPIVRLYTTAYGAGTYNFKFRNKVIIAVKDSARYRIPTDKSLYDQWTRTNAYAYDLLLPPARADALYKTMQQDINRYFNTVCTIEKRMVKCQVLVRTSKRDKIASRGGKPYIGRRKDNTEAVWQMKNMPFENFTATLSILMENKGLPTPLIDATGFSEKADIAVNADALEQLDITALRQALKKYDLDLIEKDWLTDVLVIREKKQVQTDR